MKTGIQLLLDQVPAEAADKILVELATRAMENKLTAKRIAGASGWHSSTASTELLMANLLNQLGEDKPDLVDVMNIAAMIFVRAELYGDAA